MLLCDALVDNRLVDSFEAEVETISYWKLSPKSQHCLVFHNARAVCQVLGASHWPEPQQASRGVFLLYPNTGSTARTITKAIFQPVVPGLEKMKRKEKDKNQKMTLNRRMGTMLHLRTFDELPELGRFVVKATGYNCIAAVGRITKIWYTED
jgi:hypothetical protein